MGKTADNTIKTLTQANCQPAMITDIREVDILMFKKKPEEKGVAPSPFRSYRLFVGWIIRVV